MKSEFSNRIRIKRTKNNINSTKIKSLTGIIRSESTCQIPLKSDPNLSKEKNVDEKKNGIFHLLENHATQTKDDKFNFVDPINLLN